MRSREEYIESLRDGREVYFKGQRVTDVTTHPEIRLAIETVCRNVKRWRDGDHIERWVGWGLLVAEHQFRKVIGHRQIPLLLSAMATAVSKKPIAKGAAAA